MSVHLTVIDARDEIEGPNVSEVPDGFRIIVRRCADGADVFVLPGLGRGAPPPARTPIDHLIAVHSFTVKRSRPGCAEIAIVDGDGAEWRLFLGGDAGLELATCLRSGEPVSAQGTHEAALARRANAEAEALEMDIAERRRAARANDVHVRADRLKIETVDGLVAIGATHLDDGRELRIDIDPVRIPWLIEKLAAAMPQAEPGER